MCVSINPSLVGTDLSLCMCVGNQCSNVCQFFSPSSQCFKTHYPQTHSTLQTDFACLLSMSV